VTAAHLPTDSTPGMSHDEALAYAEFKAAAGQLATAEQARGAAVQRFQAALAKLNSIVAPPPGP